MLDGLAREEETLGDLRVPKSLGEQHGNLALSLRQACGQVRAGDAGSRVTEA
jgi:hypothetical protein